MLDSRPLEDVSDADIVDLRIRLQCTRWAQPWPSHPSLSDAATEDLRRLVSLWANTFDWRAAERRISGLPWHESLLDGTPVRYLKFDAEGAPSLPIVLSHGWPSTVLELVGLARRLAWPSCHGRPGAPSFAVVVPALPGFPGSPQRSELPARIPTHELWHLLMHDELGFSSYAAHGGDLRAGITSRLGLTHPEAVRGIHLLAVADPAHLDRSTVTAKDQSYLDQASAWFDADGTHEHQQMTRPLTLAPGLSDSPSGLLAWIVEKCRDWSDCDGIRSRRFSDDFVLTQASLYWYSNSISTSFRPYWEHHHRLTEPIDRVQVPTAVAVFPHDLVRPLRSWAERTYDLRRFTVIDRGGHFAARRRTRPSRSRHHRAPRRPAAGRRLSARYKNDRSFNGDRYYAEHDEAPIGVERFTVDIWPAA